MNPDLVSLSGTEWPSHCNKGEVQRAGAADTIAAQLLLAAKVRVLALLSNGLQHNIENRVCGTGTRGHLSGKSSTNPGY